MNKKNIIFIFCCVLLLFFCLFWCLNNTNNIITFGRGTHVLKDDLYIPPEKTLIIKPGAHLKIGNGLRIIVDGRIVAIGSKDNKIIFSSLNGSWRGIEINGKKDKIDLKKYKKSFKDKDVENTELFSFLKHNNIFVNCSFAGLATNGVRDVSNRKRAVIEVNNSALSIVDSVFNDIVHMGVMQLDNSFLFAYNNTVTAKLVMKVVHAINSVSFIANNTISPMRYEYQTWPDGVFVNSGVGVVVDNIFDGLSDDAIDFDGALAYIIGNRVKNTFDDGIDIDNKSEAYIVNNNINNVAEDGILTSNQSVSYVFKNTIDNVGNGIAVRNGGKAFVDDLSVGNSNIGALMYQGVPFVLTIEDFNNIKDKVVSVSRDEMNNIGIYEVENPSELGDFLEDMYYLNNGYMVLSHSIDQSDTYFGLFLFLKKILKLVDILSLDDLSQDFLFDDGLNKLLIKYNNYLYIKNSNMNNVDDLFVFKRPYCIELENMKVNGMIQNNNIALSKDNFCKDSQVVSTQHDYKEYIEGLIEKIRLIY